GDHPKTAAVIAAELGLADKSKVISAGQSQMSSSSAGLFHPGSIGRVSEAETCSEQTGREKRILLSSPYAIALVISGLELEAMPDDALNRTVQDVSVFARVNPEHKLRIVKALQRQ